MSTLLYTRYELLRTVRNRRFFLISLVVPVLFYFLIAGPNKNDKSLLSSGLPAPLYYMVGLLAFGTMAAMIGAGARIASERSVGWNRQLRISPLTPLAYFRTKLVTSYLTAGMTIILL